MKDFFSRLTATLRPHSRLRAQADAYADGELGPPWLARFEAHLRQCEECSRTVEAARAVKTLLASLPQEDAPRPFRLTHQMANAPARQVPRPLGQAPLRFAQAATALSAIALLAVVTLSPSNGGSSERMTAAANPAASASESKAALPSSAAATAASGSQFQAATPGAGDGSVSGASVPEAPRPPATGILRSSADASPSPPSPVPARDTAESPAAPVAQAGPFASGGGDARRWLEVSLAAVMTAAGLGWIAIVLKTRRKVS